MSRFHALLACLFFVASATQAQSAPKDSPGTIYIDGVACNLACQAYLAWSRQVLAQQTTATAPAKPRRPARVAQPAVQPKPQRVAKLPTPRPSSLAPSPVENAPARAEPVPPVSADPPPPAQQDAKVSPSETPAAPASNGPDVVAATPTPEPRPSSPEPPAATAAEPSTPSPSNPPTSSDTAALAPTDKDGGEMVAILLVRSEIKSVSDLTDKIIAVDDSQAEYSVADLRKAIMAAGAGEFQLSDDKTAALVRVIDGEVPAAVVSVMSSKSTEVWNAGLSGFNVLRIPLPPATTKRG